MVLQSLLYIQIQFIKKERYYFTGDRSRLKDKAVPSIFSFRPPIEESPRAKRLKTRLADTRVHQAELAAQPGPEYHLEIEIKGDVVDGPIIEQEVTNTDDQANQCDIETLGRLSVEHLQNNPKMMNYYTGFNDHDHFLFFFNILGQAAYHLSYQCGMISPLNQCFLTIMKLRQCKEDIELSLLFGISESTVSRIIVTWINFMYFQLKELEPTMWASREVISEHMPSDFKKKFPQTRVILDATEIPIHKPSNVDSQATTWSFYKHRNTLKTMTGCTPNGAVSYVSTSYGGSCSDRQIIERSSLLNQGKFESGDSIMADRGIMVQDLFASKNVMVNTPTMLKGKSQLDPHEVVRDRRVASKRIHIERIIGMSKTYKILKQELSGAKVPLGSRITFICFALTNFRNCIVSKNA